MTRPLFDSEADAPEEGGIVGAYPAVRVSNDPVEPSRAALQARQDGLRLWETVKARLVARA